MERVLMFNHISFEMSVKYFKKMQEGELNEPAKGQYDHGCDGIGEGLGSFFVHDPVGYLASVPRHGHLTCGAQCISNRAARGTRAEMQHEQRCRTTVESPPPATGGRKAPPHCSTCNLSSEVVLLMWRCQEK